MNRLQACLFLRFLPRLGHISARRLWEFSKSPEAIFDRLKTVPKESLDNIALHTQNSVSKTATLLLKLEMKGCVKPLPGKFFEWI